MMDVESADAEPGALAGCVYYEIESACNLSCSHCGGFGRQSSGLRLHRDLLLPFHERLVELGIHSAVLTGGEPTLHPDLPNIARSLAELGSVVITTNGTTERLNDLVHVLSRNRNVIVQISMDGTSEGVVDCIRGQDVHRRSLQAVEQLVEMGFARQVGLSFTILKTNAHEAVDLVDFAASRCLRYVHFPQLLPIGSALENWSELALEADEEIAAEEALLALSADEQLRTVVTVNRVEQVLSRALYGHAVDCLTRACLKVDPAGRVFPCPACSAPPLSLGNIGELSLPQALRERLRECLPRLHTMARRPMECCASCPVAGACDARFCENCGLLGKPVPWIASCACKVMLHHYTTAAADLSGL